MKQITIQMPNLKKFEWKSPVNTISALSVLWAVVFMIHPGIIIYGGIYNYPVGIFGFLGELLLYSFLHGGILHVLSNILFFMTIGRSIEIWYGRVWTWYLWWWTTVFVGIFLFLFSDNPTIGGSGFAMSLLAVYAYNLYKHKHSDYKWALLLMVINLAFGFGATVSFMGHFAGAVAWGLYAWYKQKYSHLQLPRFR
jgi:membrane associated rhomboid family serine protease